MELIRTLREKSQTRKEASIQHQAEYLITLSDFADSLFIAFQGTPLVPINEEWTSKEIIEKLSEVRQNYINSKLHELC
jgi:hypothetical protein